MALISVVIPSYNCASYISDAIMSVINQRYGDVEIIVVDDGSQDDTRDVVASWLHAAEIRYLFRENCGLPAARNAGIKMSSAKYVTLLDADDALAPNALTLMLNSLERSGRAWCVIDIEKFWDDYAEVRRTELPETNLLYGILRDDFIRRAMFFRREALLDIGLYDEQMKYREDWDLNIRMIEAGQPFDVIQQPLYRYRKRPGSITTGNQKKVLAYTAALLAKHHRRLADAGDAAVAQIYADNMWHLARQYFYEQRDWRSAIDCMRKSLIYGRDHAGRARSLAGVPGRMLLSSFRRIAH